MRLGNLFAFIIIWVFFVFSLLDDLPEGVQQSGNFHSLQRPTPLRPSGHTEAPSVPPMWFLQYHCIYLDRKSSVNDQKPCQNGATPVIYTANQIAECDRFYIEGVAPPEEGNHCMFLRTSVHMPPNDLSRRLLPEQAINIDHFPCLLESFRQTRPNRRKRAHWATRKLSESRYNVKSTTTNCTVITDNDTLWRRRFWPVCSVLWGLGVFFSLGICVLVKQHTVCLTRYLSHNKLFHSQETQTLTNFRDKQDILTVRDQSISLWAKERLNFWNILSSLCPDQRKTGAQKKREGREGAIWCQDRGWNDGIQSLGEKWGRGSN